MSQQNQPPSAPPPSYSKSVTTSSQSANPAPTTTQEYYARPPSPTPSTQTSASTILPSYEDTGSYKGFPSEAAYLAALKKWAESKQYVQPSEEAQMLSGFYGAKTMDDYTGDMDGGRKEKGEKREGLGRLWKRVSRKEGEGS